MPEDLNTPATKGDIAQLRSEMKEHGAQLRSELKEQGAQVRSEMKEMRDQLTSEFQHGFDDLKETVRGQTELLKAFYNYTTTTEAKLNDAELRDGASGSG